MKNIKFTILGVATLLFALTLNFRHALDDYGVLDNKLHVEVLAQSNTTDGGSTTDGGGTTDGGELPPLIITCSGNGQGVCYKSDWEPIPFGRYRVTCYATGDPDDYCMPGIF